MSGPQSPALAGAAMGHALRAEANARGFEIGQVVRERLLDSLGRRKQPERESLPARTWAAIDLRTRTVLVMLGASKEGDPRRLAAQPWASFPEADQCSMASIARQLRQQLDSAASLF